MRSTSLVPAAFFAGLALVVPAAQATIFLGPSPYLSFNDSPFAGRPTSLTTFEGGGLPAGVSATAGWRILTAGAIDSVDADDGVIDGSGLGGRSFYSGSNTALRLTFDPAILGQLPQWAGLVWTDAGSGVAQVTFEAFGPTGASLGIIGPFLLGDGSSYGGTAEDRFFGVEAPGGISAIELRQNVGDWEVDHVQFGPAIPAPSTALLIALAGVIPGRRRRR